MLAEAQARLGRIDHATRTIADALACEAVQDERWCLPELLRIEAGICVRRRQADRAEELLLGAIELAEKIGAKAWVLRTHNDLAALNQRRKLCAASTSA
jgi:hypothetical protein